MGVYVYAHVHKDVWWGQKRVQVLLELELQVLVSHLDMGAGNPTPLLC